MKLGQALTAELDYLNAGLTLVGAIGGAGVTAFGGWLIARRRGVTSATIEEIKDRASFRLALMQAAKESQETAAAALDQVEVLSKRIGVLLVERDELFQANARKTVQITILEATTRNCQERIESLAAELGEHKAKCKANYAKSAE
jgi:hypothetical protein